MEYKIKRSRRKTVSIHINDDLSLEVRAPLLYSRANIDAFVNNHTQWIEKHQRLIKERTEQLNFAEQNKETLKNQAAQYILPKVEYFSKIMGLKPVSVKITSAKKRYGSCSGKNGLCFSCYLMLHEEKAIDYVIVHELAHIKHHNHSKDFYNLIAKYMPDYKERIRMIKK